MDATEMEYISMLHDKYDSLEMNIQHDMEVGEYFFEIFIEQLSKVKQTVLILSSSPSESDKKYKHFCSYLGTNPTNSCHSYYEFQEGSIIVFRSYYNTQKQLFDNCDVIMLDNIHITDYSLEFMKKIQNIKKKIIINSSFNGVVCDTNTHLVNIDNTSNFKQLIRGVKLQKIRDRLSILNH